jgi:phosphatidylserine synthase
MKLNGQRAAVRIERQLTVMSICQGFSVIVSSVSNSIQFLYSTIISSVVKDLLSLAQENLFIQITPIFY